MPDISMCASETCRLRKECYRNPASGTQPSEWVQPWADFPDDTDEKPCPYVWRRK